MNARWSLVAALAVLGALLFPPAGRAAIDESNIIYMECHADMGEEHTLVIENWRDSVHYEQGVTCGQCHGMSDTDFGALPDPGEGKHTKPDVGRILNMCRQCHREIINHYPLSAHFQRERVSCLMCHGEGESNHAIQRASLDIIQEDRCSRCHSFDWALQAKQAFQRAETAVEDLEQTVHNLEERGYHSTRLEKLLNKAHETRERVPLELHTFQLSRIKDVTDSITDMDQHMQEEKERILAKLDAQRERQRIGAFIMVSCFFFSVLILAFRQTYIDEWRAKYGPPPEDL